MLEETVGFPVTVEVVDCKDGGYSWVVKDLHLVGQADTKEDIPVMVNEVGNTLCKFLLERFDLEFKTR